MIVGVAVAEVGAVELVGLVQWVWVARSFGAAVVVGFAPLDY